MTEFNKLKATGGSRLVLRKRDDRISELEEQADEQFDRVLQALEQQKRLAGTDLKALKAVEENALEISTGALHGEEIPQGLKEFLSVLRSDISTLQTEEDRRVRDRANGTRITSKTERIEGLHKRLLKTPNRDDALLLKHIANEEAERLMAKFDTIEEALRDSEFQRLYEIATSCDGIPARVNP